jgi:Uma2 family endonuclease
VANVVATLWIALRERTCKVYPSDLRIKIPSTGLYTYPDASVICDRPEFEDDKADTLLNPQIIVEVLSDCTEDYDRGTKFKNYRSIPSFREYLLVSQTEVLVEHASRQDDGSWLFRDQKAGERILLASIGCEIAVDELYLKVFSGALPPGR